MNLRHFPAVTQRRATGFSLLEIVIVMALIGMAMGGAIALFVISSAERQLKNAAADMELLAKRARSLAMVQQTPYAITFSNQSARLTPLVEAGYSDQELKERRDLESDAMRAGGATPKFIPVRETVSFSDFAVSVRRWGTVNWSPMLRSDPQVWRFDPNGICEPVGVRLEYEDGWIEMEFHPLSAGIRDQTMEAKR